MAFQPIPGGIWIPPWHLYGSGGTITIAGHQINAATEYVAAIIRVPKTGTLDGFEFRTSTIGTFPGNGLRVSFQDVDLTTGLPDGGVDQFRVIAASPGANTWVQPGLITSDGTDTGSKRSVTAGDYLALVVDFNPTYTTGDLIIANGGTGAHAMGFPYNVFNGGKQTTTNLPLVALKYNDGTYGVIHGVYPYATQNAHSFNVDTVAADEIGLAFQFPGPVKVSGIWLRADFDGNADIVLYDSDGSTPLATLSFDADVRGQGAGTIHILPLPGEITLSAGAVYRVVVKPTTTTSVAVYSFDVASVDHLDVVAGQDFHYTSRVDAGSWTPVTTRMPWMGLQVTAIDDGVSAAPLALAVSDGLR